MLNMLQERLNSGVPVALINLKGILNNAIKVKGIIGNAKLCAVVKSDAYGHGLCECASVLNDVCDYFAVASLSEGIALKLSGVTKPVICLIPVEEISSAIFYGVEFAVHTEEYAKKVLAIATKLNRVAHVHLAVNTGMNRLGVNTLGELKSILNLFAKSTVLVKGVFSHFYNGLNRNDCLLQYNKFVKFCSLANDYSPDIIKHVASSSSLNFGEEFCADMVRVGLAIYGYSAINGQFALEKCMKVIAKRVQSRSLSSNESLLYGNYKTERDLNVGLYLYGYSNGRRSNFNLLNNACMNMCATENKGKYFCLLSDAEKQAKYCNTIPYEILTSYGINCKKFHYFGDLYEGYFR